MGPRRRGRWSDDRRSGRASSAFHRNQQRRPQRAPPLIKVVVCHVSNRERFVLINKKEKKDHKKEDPKPLCV